MFVETKREGEATTTEKPTLDGLIAWLNGKDPKTRYCFDEATTCVAGQYYQSIGRKPEQYIESIADEMGVDGSGLYNALSIGTWTFGACLTRLRNVGPPETF